MLDTIDEIDYSKTMLDARGLYVIYRGKGGAENVVALRGLNLAVEQGEFLAIVGPSGSGKSSLLRCIGGLQHPSAGVIRYHGMDITRLSEQELVPIRREMIGFVFQEGNLLEMYSGFQNVVRTLRYSGVGYSEARSRATEVLGMLGLKNRMHDLPQRLSGGERQRVAIARALANKPRFILADEPTGNIDYANTDNVMAIFNDLHKEVETSFLIVTHSQHVASYANRKLELRDGRFTSQIGDVADLSNLQESRSVIINEDGSMTFPPEMIGVFEEYGRLWDFKINIKDKIPQIVGTPSPKVNEPMNCPVCSTEIPPNTFFCKSCGAKVRG